MLGTGITSAHSRRHLKRVPSSLKANMVAPVNKVSVRVCAPYCFSLSERNVIRALFNGSLWMKSTCMPAKIACFGRSECFVGDGDEEEDEEEEEGGDDVDDSK